jgi:hypothetical protein
MTNITTKKAVAGYYERSRGYVDIPRADWDNLIVLDACRTDAFKRVIGEQNIETRLSKGSATYEWAERNFTGQTLDDTVYVTANPHINIECGDCFHHIESVWRDEWDKDHNTVLPNKVTEAAMEIARDYPNKRLIIHYIQPHSPYIGETAAELPQEGNLRRTRQRALYNDLPSVESKVFELLRIGEVDRELVWQAYVESLEAVWESVQRLLPELEGKTVVTADHGEAFGEWSFCDLSHIYAHPPKTPANVLIEVPWYVDKATERKRIVAEDSGMSDEIDQSDVQERLRQLGYKT